MVLRGVERFFSGRRGRVRFFVVFGAIEAVILIALAYLVTYQGPVPPSGTINGIELEIAGQGQSSVGNSNWFGPTTQNFTGGANGFPLSYVDGSTFTYDLNLDNSDSVNHTIERCSAAAPFSVVHTSTPLPATVMYEDDALLVVTVQTPSTGGTYTVLLTLSVS
jgi:hypothetical protein